MYLEMVQIRRDPRGGVTHPTILLSMPSTSFYSPLSAGYWARCQQLKDEEFVPVLNLFIVQEWKKS
jgi:hypothetical protein